MASRVPPFIRAFYAEGAPTAELHPNVVVEADDVVFTKPRYGAFTDTDLESRLRELGIDTLLITGIATNICCDTTAREAAQRDFHVYFVADATSTFEMQGVAGADLYAATSPAWRRCSPTWSPSTTRCGPSGWLHSSPRRVDKSGGRSRQNVRGLNRQTTTSQGSR